MYIKVFLFIIIIPASTLQIPSCQELHGLQSCATIASRKMAKYTVSMIEKQFLDAIRKTSVAPKNGADIILFEQFLGCKSMYTQDLDFYTKAYAALHFPGAFYHLFCFLLIYVYQLLIIGLYIEMCLLAG